MSNKHQQTENTTYLEVLHVWQSVALAISQVKFDQAGEPLEQIIVQPFLGAQVDGADQMDRLEFVLAPKKPPRKRG